MGACFMGANCQKNVFAVPPICLRCFPHHLRHSTFINSANSLAKQVTRLSANSWFCFACNSKAKFVACSVIVLCQDFVIRSYWKTLLNLKLWWLLCDLRQVGYVVSGVLVLYQNILTPWLVDFRYVWYTSHVWDAAFRRGSRCRNDYPIQWGKNWTGP